MAEKWHDNTRVDWEEEEKSGNATVLQQQLLRRLDFVLHNGNLAAAGLVQERLATRTHIRGGEGCLLTNMMIW